MESEQWSLSAVVNYELPLAEIVERLRGRLFQREDDRPESVAVRMEAYQRSAAPLIEFYRNLGLLLPVAATGSSEEICTSHQRPEGAATPAVRRNRPNASSDRFLKLSSRAS
jgi:adenylate kinase family enzyme